MALPAQFVNAVAVTPHDTNLNEFSALYVGGAGNLTVETVGGQTTTFSAVPAGTFVYVKVRRVRSTGTTATNIVGLS
jgi:hypothetical protein